MNVSSAVPFPSFPPLLPAPVLPLKRDVPLLEESYPKLLREEECPPCEEAEEEPEPVVMDCADSLDRGPKLRMSFEAAGPCPLNVGGPRGWRNAPEEAAPLRVW